MLPISLYISVYVIYTCYVYYIFSNIYQHIKCMYIFYIYIYVKYIVCIYVCAYISRYVSYCFYIYFYISMPPPILRIATQWHMPQHGGNEHLDGE